MRDLTGLRFGRLTVTSHHGKSGNRQLWKCLCDCGSEKIAAGGNLKFGGTQSCGCLFRERVRAANSSHGFTAGLKKHPLYLVWRSMRSRCENPNVRGFQNYGGRGIAVCERWKNGDGVRSGFECFLADMGHRPTDNHTVERTRNDRDYSPSNCVWASRSAQSRNRRSVYQIERNGKTMTLSEAASSAGIHISTVNTRLKSGWTLEDALTHPVESKHRRKTR